MKARVYISEWSLRATPEREVINPVQLRADDLAISDPALPFIVQHWYSQDVTAEGLPTVPWCLSIVQCDDTAKWAGMAVKFEMPAYHLDTPTNAIPQAEKDAFIAVMQGYGIDPVYWIGSGTAWGTMRKLKKLLMPADPNPDDVGAPPGAFA